MHDPEAVPAVPFTAAKRERRGPWSVLCGFPCWIACSNALPFVAPADLHGPAGGRLLLFRFPLRGGPSRKCSRPSAGAPGRLCARTTQQGNRHEHPLFCSAPFGIRKPTLRRLWHLSRIGRLRAELPSHRTESGTRRVGGADNHAAVGGRAEGRQPSVPVTNRRAHDRPMPSSSFALRHRRWTMHPKNRPAARNLQWLALQGSNEILRQEVTMSRKARPAQHGSNPYRDFSADNANPPELQSPIATVAAAMVDCEHPQTARIPVCGSPSPWPPAIWCSSCGAITFDGELPARWYTPHLAAILEKSDFHELALLLRSVSVLARSPSLKKHFRRAWRSHIQANRHSKRAADARRFDEAAADTTSPERKPR